jgi:hypothetical protein
MVYLKNNLYEIDKLLKEMSNDNYNGYLEKKDKRIVNG